MWIAGPADDALPKPKPKKQTGGLGPLFEEKP
jgi:hypothetical protein